MMANNQSLVEIIREQMASEELELPVFPNSVVELQGLLSKPDFTVDQIAEVILKDQTLCSQVLRLANSSFFSGLKEITTIPKAVVRLGTKQVLNCVIMASQRNLYRSKNKIISVYMERLWKHASACALGAKWIAEKTGYREIAQEALLAALLHDIGKLFLLKVLEQINAAGKSEIPLSGALISEILDHMHCKQGFTLLKKWDIPELYCCVARDHHREAFNPDSLILAMVGLVNQATRKLGVGINHDPSIVLATLPETQALGIKEITLAELEILIEDAVLLSSS
jgi:HD-like signal output (HDOD) protein